MVISFFEEGFEFGDRSLDLLFAAILPRNKKRAPFACELATSVLRRRGLSLALDSAPVRCDKTSPVVFASIASSCPISCLTFHFVRSTQYFDGLLGLRPGSESELRDEACDIVKCLCAIDKQLVSRVIPQFEMLLKVRPRAFS